MFDKVDQMQCDLKRHSSPLIRAHWCGHGYVSNYCLPLQIVLLFSLLLSLSAIVRAGELTALKLPVYPISSNEKLYGTVVSEVIRDVDGFLWVASDNGLLRYDGYTLKRVGRQAKDGFREIAYTAGLHIDLDEKLWVLSSQLNRYDPATESFEQFDISDSNVVRALYKDRNQVLWFGGDDFGFRGYDLKAQKLVHQSMQSQRAQRIKAIVPTLDSDYIWIGSSAGLFRFDTETYQLDYIDMNLETETDIDTIRDIHVGSGGSVWVATDLGLVAVDQQTKVATRYPLPSKHDLWSVYEDSSGHIWVGTDKDGVYRLAQGSSKFEHLPPSVNQISQLPLAAITDITEDSFGSLWLSTSQFGVYRVDKGAQRFTVYQHQPKGSNSLSLNNIRGLIEGKDGRIWIGTDGGGLDVFDPKTNHIEHYRHDAKDQRTISSDSIISLAQDRVGNIWVGTWGGGLNRFDPQSGGFSSFQKQHETDAQSWIAGNNIFNILVSSQGHLYLSTWEQGLQVFKPNKNSFESYNPKGLGAGSGISNIDINVIVEQSNGTLWVGGHSGLEKLNPRTQKFTLVDFGEHSSILDMHLDEEANSLWIASSEGLIKLDINTYAAQQFNASEDPAANYLVSLEVDNDGNLWLGSRNGLYAFNTTNEVFRSFDRRDGLPGNKFNVYSSLKTRDGKMYFGGTQGLVTFDPNSFPRNERAPKVVMTGFELFQKTVEVEPGGVLPQSIQYIDKINLNHIYRDISFEFSALNLIAPSKNRFRYRLLGLEGGWTDTDGSGRRVRYTNLSPGKYRFQVHAANNDGVWSKKGAFVDLEVKPPWWMQWWFRGVLGFAFVSISTLIFYWRMQLNIQQKRRLESTITEKTQALKQAHRSLKELNLELERRVDVRTNELSVEIEERRIAEEKLFYMAFHDGLTGLSNRAWLLQQISKLIKTAHAKDGYQFALLFLDGDRFKQVNDTHGHALGDLLLVAAAHRLQDVLPDSHHAIRLGGDEFTILIEKIETPNQVVGIAELITSAFEQPFKIEQNTMYFKVSIGMVLCDSYYEKPEEILRDADIALYKSKELGKGVYQMFDANMREETLELAELEADLQTAIANEQFHLVYQPIIDLETGRLISFEALLRWIHPTRGFIPPDKFIPLAEESGAIFSIGLWVLREACLQLRSWLDEFDFDQEPMMGVNLSPLQLSQPDLMEQFDDVISEAEINCRLLKLEITESALMQQTDLVTTLLDKVRLRGIELAIDDFGTGYSSLSYLDQLPVQVLKIDRSFVNGMNTYREARKRPGKGGASEIVKATISLAHALNMKVIAEGIEQESQLEALRQMGCDMGQGYFIAKPMNASDATDYLRSLYAKTEKEAANDPDALGNVDSIMPEVQEVDRRSRRRKGLL